MSRTTTPGRRSLMTARRRFDAVVVLAVLLPLLTGGALLLVGTGERAPVERPPQRTDLVRATVVCPSPLVADDALALLTSAGATGTVSVGSRQDQATVRIEAGTLTRIRRRGPVVVTGVDDLAPGLVGGRFGSPLAGAECLPPSASTWFTAVGAAARHSSVLELVNPDAGPAVVDVRLYGRDGELDVPELRGVAVPARGNVLLDLAQVTPRRDELAMEVTTSRGRVAASVRDTYDELGAGADGEDWLPSQAAPARSNLLLGLPVGRGRRSLVLANSGDDETRATVRVVTAASVISPAGFAEVRLPPQSVVRVSLTDVLASAVAKGAVGVLVETPAPVTATLRAFVRGDLTHAVPGSRVSATTTAIVPEGRKRMLFAGATNAGVVSVTALTADGEELATKRVEVGPDRGAFLTLPKRATLLSVTPERTSVVGAVLVSGDGSAVVRLRDLDVSGLVPDVRPGLF